MERDCRLTDVRQWAHAQFAGADLGHKRRTQRLVKLAGQIASDSMASLPKQTESWADLKAAYRLFDNDAVTFGAVAGPHWKLTRDGAAGRKLILEDTTELDFGCTRQLRGVGPVGSGFGKGFLLHNAMMVDPKTGEVLGLAAQDLFLRKPAPKDETRAQRRRRDRESEVWGRVIEAIGPPPPGAQYVHVMDRGADDFEAFCRARRQRSDWVVRLKTLHRRVRDAEGVERTIGEVLDQAAPSCCLVLPLRARPGQPARKARLELKFARIEMPPPRQPAASLKGLDPGPIEGWVIEVRECDPPRKGVKPLHWVLFTSLEAGTVEAALEVVGYYESRWMIEEFHKALKTGCRIERRQLAAGERLAPLIGLMSVQAVRLMQLKSVARASPERPAEEVVPGRYISLLERCRKSAPGSLVTARDFFRALAKLGGFLGRKGDGEPGWQTIWGGWEKLYGMIRGAELIAESRH